MASFLRIYYTSWSMTRWFPAILSNCKSSIKKSFYIKDILPESSAGPFWTFNQKPVLALSLHTIPKDCVKLGKGCCSTCTKFQFIWLVNTNLTRTNSVLNGFKKKKCTPNFYDIAWKQKGQNTSCITTPFSDSPVQNVRNFYTYLMNFWDWGTLPIRILQRHHSIHN